MNEAPKNKIKWLAIVMKLLRWIFLIIGAIATFTAGQFLFFRLTEHSVPSEKALYALVNIIAIAFCLWLLSPIHRRIFPPCFRFIKCFYRWLFTWRTMRRVLIGVAIFATLIAIFYTEEDWRGKRAWENCKRELEAKGAVLDWDKYIPPPVPDDQNFFTASTNIMLRFKKSENDAESELASKSSWLRITYSADAFPVFNTAKTGPLVVAELSVLPANDINVGSAKDHLVVNFNSSGAREQVERLVEATIGQSIHGAAGFQFSEFQLSNIPPARIFLQVDVPLSIADLENLIPTDTVTNIGHLRIETTVDKGIFRVVLTGVHVTAAADYLKWSDQFEPAFDEIREALKRPYALIPGDYSQPYLIPIPNFVMMRGVAQTLAQRAQCDFLLGQPDKALRELTLTHDICRILEKRPSGKPMTLVEAMINVAITGLYVSTIADGFRLHVWQEPQLAALQEQLKEIDLSPFVAKSFNEQRASACFMLANISRAEIENQRLVETKRYGISVKPLLTDPEFLFVTFAPRGWIYQSMIVIAEFDQKMQTAVDLTNDALSPQEIDASMRGTEKALDNHPLYNFFPRLFIPNVTKAWQTTAHNQTLVNEAQIACALERYRLAHGAYPETLDALMPQFIEKLPHDIINGQPLHYRRTDDGRFVLYSVGWNEKDDGGSVVFRKDSFREYSSAVDTDNGDWVWQYPSK